MLSCFHGAVASYHASVRVTSLHGWSTSLVVTLVGRGNRDRTCRVVAGMLAVLILTLGYLAPAAGDDAPVRATEVAVAQRVADRVDCAVDVA